MKLNKVREKLLEYRVKRDIKKLGLPTDFSLSMRGYSKTHNGLYDPSRDLVIMYCLEKNGEEIDYCTILKYAIHEALHHYQWKHTNYKRVRGVMHNTEFKALETKYWNKALDLEILTEEYLMEVI